MRKPVYMPKYTLCLYPVGDGVGWHGVVEVEGDTVYSTDLWHYKLDAAAEGRQHIQKLKAAWRKDRDAGPAPGRAAIRCSVATERSGGRGT